MSFIGDALKLVNRGGRQIDVMDAVRQFGPVLETVMPGVFRRQLAPTARETVEAGARGVFRAPTQPAVQQGARQLYRMAGEAAQPAASTATQAVRRSEPAVMGVFQPPAQPAMRSAMQAVTPPAPVPPAAPVTQTAENFVPLAGRQLDLFSGFNRLTNRAGTETAEGFKIGGTTFNPADVMPEGAYTQRIRELARSKGVPEELFIQQMQRPGASLAEVADFASIPAQTGFFAKPAEFGMYQARNLLKNNIANLGELVRNNPRLAASLGIGGGVAATAYGVSQLTGQDATAPETPLQSPMGPTSESVDAGGLVNDPQAAQNRQINAAQQMAAEMDAAARAVIPPAAYTGAGGQTRITTRGENEALTAAKQQYTKPQQALKNYYGGREAYAQFPAHKAEIISELSKRGVLDTPELVTWASQNPQLAYELLRKATGSNVLPSQQVPQQTQKVMNAPAGSDMTKNIVGTGQGAADAAVGSQGGSDISNFAQPYLTDEIRQIDPALIYALQGRNLI